MKININANPPEGTRRMRSYADLVGALKINGGWVAVLASEVAGVTRA
jgi:hypothetical protein